MKKIQADVVVIGGGATGIGALRNVCLHSDNVYLVEDNVFGMTCARVGCMPFKLLIAATGARHHALHTDLPGVYLDRDSTVVNGEEVMQCVKSERGCLIGSTVADVEEWPADKRIMGSAEFIDESIVQIDGHTRITAKSFVIATGSRLVILSQWQSLGDCLVISDSVFPWNTLLKSAAVFRSGVIGLELSQALHRLGTKVGIFGLDGVTGGISDPAVSDEMRIVFDEELKLHLDAKAEVRLDVDGNIEVHWGQGGEKGVLVAEYMLIAVGCRPNVDNIDLENINIEEDACDTSVADPLTMQTSVPHIFIAGGASDRLPLLRRAADQNKTAGDSTNRYPNIDGGLRRSTISVVFINPQIGFVGLKYAQVTAQYQSDEFIIDKVSFKNQGRSRMMLVNKGYMRLYAEKATGCFIDAEILGPAAEYLARLLTWAHRMKMIVE